MSRSEKYFIGWDGEGTQSPEPVEMQTVKPDGTPLTYYWWPEEGRLYFNHQRKAQPYVLLANSVGDAITDETGLGTKECLELILDTKQRHPNSIMVGYGFNYDINQILKDVDMYFLPILQEINEVHWQGYHIEWMPRKWLYVRHGNTGRSAKIYDVIGFFQMSFLETCREYLGEDDPDLGLIEVGKTGRVNFTWDDMEDLIIPYNQMELAMLVRVMNRLRDDLKQVGIKPQQWHGAGAIASTVMNNKRIPIARNQPHEVLDASQFAYAGGRFEQFHMGYYPGTVWEYDNNSAYPAAAIELPNLQRGTWKHVERFDPKVFGVWLVDYKSTEPGGSHRPEPLFCRDGHGLVSYPREVQGWYWTPEARLTPDSVIEGWVFREDDPSDRPFAFIKKYYHDRVVFKRNKNPLERAVKLILNSLYGKVAQTIGGEDGPPKWHQMEYAGYITSHCRAKMYEAIQQNPSAIIAVETDAVFSMEPLNLHIDGEVLGAWKVKEFKEICYIQSGFYYGITSDGEFVYKYRGMDREPGEQFPAGLPYRDVLDYLRDYTGLTDTKQTLSSTSTRFIGLGLSLQTQAIWRSWETREKKINLNQRPGSSKRTHLAEDCFLCQAGISMYRELHPMKNTGYSGPSHARSLPWRKVYQEEDREWRAAIDRANEADKWQ